MQRVGGWTGVVVVYGGESIRSCVYVSNVSNEWMNRFGPHTPHRSRYQIIHFLLTAVLGLVCVGCC